MSRETWAALEPLLDQAIDVPRAQRDAFLHDRVTDPSLRAELERLLAEYERQDSLLERPGFERFARLFDDKMSRLPNVLGDHYHIVREIGRGGMATVYLAHDSRHDRDVAVKVLHADVAEALGAERFLAEIKTTAQLPHPHILPLHDSGEADGFLYYTMPYIEGGSLRQHLERTGRLPPDDAIRIASQVSSALEAAHRHAVIHRDIKPENILLHAGTALVADFGIALGLESASPRVTNPGMHPGTPQYMSPEQASGDAPVDARSDVYALGTVLYEMLAGEPPFKGPSANAIVVKRASTDAPSVRTPRPDVPESIAAVIARALARDPARRWATAADFSVALREAGRGGKTSTVTLGLRATRRVARRPFAWIALLAAAGIAVALTTRGSHPDTTSNRPTNPEALAQYNQARYFFDKRGSGSLDKAREYFERSIVLDSTFAPAYAGLADVYTSYAIGNLGNYSPTEFFPKALNAANKALALDSMSADAHASLGQIRVLYQFDWSGAEASLMRALALNSRTTIAHTYLAVLREFTGRYDEGIAQAQAAVDAEPLSTFASIELGRAYLFRRQYDKAMAQLRSVMERDQLAYRPRMLLGEAYELVAQYDSAVAQMEIAAKLAPTSSRVTAMRAHAYALAGRRSDAERELAALKARTSYVAPFDIALIYLGLGRLEETCDWLDKSYEDHSLRPYVVDPLFDVLRAHPRYQALLRKLGVPANVPVAPANTPGS